MIRPEAAATLTRWREVLAGGGLIGLGLWLLAKPGYLLPAVGLACALLGTGLAVVGLRRLWFRAPGQAPGIVQVIEGQVGYFGPAGPDTDAPGGFIALDDLAALALSADGTQWQLTAADGTVLRIPRAARGAEDLLDAFVRLPGLDPSAVVRAAAAGPAGHDRRLWQRAAPAPALPRTAATPPR